MNLLSMSVSAGVLILLIIVIRALAIHKVPKAAFLVLWGVVIVRLLIPGTVSPLNLLARAGFIEPETIYTYNYVEEGVTVQGGEVELDGAAPGSLLGGGRAFVHQLTEGVLTQKWPWFIWGLGIGCLATCFLYAYARSRRVLNMAIPTKKTFTTKRGRRKVRVYLSDRIMTPLTYGVLRPRIVLPRQMMKGDRAHLRYAIRHEMTHIERLDMVYKLLLLLCVCLHWYNPLVWAMYFLACRDIELSCDEKVVRAARSDRRKDYAMTLIELEEKRSLPLPMVAALGKTAIEERVVSIMRTKKTTFSGFLIAVLLVGFSLIVFADAEVTPNVVDISAREVGEYAVTAAVSTSTYASSAPESLTPLIVATAIEESTPAQITTRRLYPAEVSAPASTYSLAVRAVSDDSTRVQLRADTVIESSAYYAASSEWIADLTSYQVVEVSESISEDDTAFYEYALVSALSPVFLQADSVADVDAMIELSDSVSIGEIWESAE